MKERCCVLHVYKDFFPPIAGGIEKHMSVLCRHQQRVMDVKVLIANRRARTEWATDGVPVLKVAQIGRFQSTPVAPTFPLWLRRAQADILHFHLPNPIADLSFLLARPGGVVIASYHSDIPEQKWFSRVYRPFLNNFLRRCSFIITGSKEYLESSPVLREFAAKCVIVPYGIELDRFALTSKVRSDVETIRGRLNKPVLLFVGKFRHYKGLDYLLHAMRSVDAVLMLVGDGAMEERARTLAREIGVEERVRFVGAVGEEALVSYLHACDLFVLPSINRSESFGIAMVEAMACGKPAISTEVGTGTSYVNRHLQTGLVVPPSRSEALGEAIRLLLHDPGLMAKMGRAARERVEREFTAERMVGQVSEVYARALAAGRGV